MTILLSTNANLRKLAKQHIENLVIADCIEDIQKFFNDDDSECDMLILDWETIEEYAEELVDWIVNSKAFIKLVLIVKDNLPCVTVCKTEKNDKHIRVVNILNKERYNTKTVGVKTLIVGLKSQKK
jgi:hypothetical protein